MDTAWLLNHLLRLDITDWLRDNFNKILDWIKDVLLWVPRKVWEAILDALASVIEAIPIPSWLQSIPSLPSSVGYFFDMIALQFGVGVVIAAYLIRFSIRRIPVIG